MSLPRDVSGWRRDADPWRDEPLTELEPLSERYAAGPGGGDAWRCGFGNDDGGIGGAAPVQR
jgi:hypothetical protein